MEVQLKTGYEGRELEKMMQAVSCPALGNLLMLNHCEKCSYHQEIRSLSRGPNQEPKLVVICNAPRVVPTSDVFAVAPAIEV